MAKSTVMTTSLSQAAIGRGRAARNGLDIELKARESPRPHGACGDNVESVHDHPGDARHVWRGGRGGQSPASSTASTASFDLYTPGEERAVIRNFDRRLVLFLACQLSRPLTYIFGLEHSSLMLQYSHPIGSHMPHL